MRKTKRITNKGNVFLGHTAAITLLILLLLSLCGCGTEQQSTGEITSLEQLNESGRCIGVAMDLPDDKLVAELFPLAKIEYFSDEPSAYSSVNLGKIDAFVFDKISLKAAIKGGLKGVRIMEETLAESNTAAAAISPVSKIPDLEAKINSFLDEIKADGTMEDMQNRWLIERDEDMPDIPAAENPDMHIVVGTTGMNTPFTYYKGTELAGYEIELAYRLAAWMNASLEFKIYNYDGIVPAALSGDIDCIFANLFVTPERQEMIRFSQPTFVGKVGVMIKDYSYRPPEYTEFSELKGKTVAMLTGAPFSEFVLSKEPEVAEFTYFNNISDLVFALESGKIDAVVTNNAIGELATNKSPDITLFPQNLSETSFGLAFKKGGELIDRWQEVFNGIPKAKLDELWEKWTGTDNEAKTLPEQDWPGANGTVRAAVCDTLEPLCYVGEDGKVLGLDNELILMMAKELDVHVKFIPLDFAAVLTSVQSGKAEIGAGCILITDERKESVDFIEYYPAAFVLLVRSVSPAAAEYEAAGGSFISSVRESFEKTFIRESRWKLFLSGIATTLIINVLSIIFGTLLGFMLFMLCRKGNAIANGFARFYVWLIGGMPVVVLLMILYYIVFGKLAISGLIVSIFAFTLIFGAAVYRMVKGGVGAIDIGQTEAAYALGFSDRRAFFRVVLPQAARHFMPQYKAQISALIKATAVVGYVAVQDLTKMGDIVRSRTYDAFFPLIAVAIIYFILAAVLIFFVDKIELRVDPRKRKAMEAQKEAEEE